MFVRVDLHSVSKRIAVRPSASESSAGEALESTVPVDNSFSELVRSQALPSLERARRVQRELGGQGERADEISSLQCHADASPLGSVVCVTWAEEWPSLPPTRNK